MFRIVLPGGGSMAKMASRILEQKEAIRLVLSADRSTSSIVPTWQDLDVLQAIDSAISPSLSLNRYSFRRQVCDYLSCPSNAAHT